MSDTDSGRERLDSWKQIADYLQRDARTVRRWEKTLALPIRRVPGGRGHSVFAYVAEIEAWLKSTPLAEADVTSNPPIDSAEIADGPGLPDRPAASPPPRGARPDRSASVGRASGSDPGTLTVRPIERQSPSGGGHERWRYSLPARERGAAAVGQSPRDYHRKRRHRTSSHPLSAAADAARGSGQLLC
jgi:hypothetical protein